MRLLIVFERYANGGFETHLDTIIRAFREQGALVACAGGPGFEESPVRNLVEAYHPFDFEALSGDRMAACAGRLVDIIKEGQFTAVHVHPYLPLLPAAIAASIVGVPYCVTFHGRPRAGHLTTILGGLITSAAGNYVLPRAAKVFAVSETVADAAALCFGTPRQDIAIIPNPLDFERFSPRGPALPKRALLLSRLDPDKQASVLGALDLFQAIRALRSDWTFTVAGSGPLRTLVEDRCRDLGIEVDLPGFRQDTASLIAEHGMVAGMGRVVLEAMAMQRIAVVSGLEGLNEVVTPANFTSHRLSNFCGVGAPRTESVPLASQVLSGIEGDHSDAQELRRLAQHLHDARLIASRVIEHSRQARTVQEGAAEAYELLQWLLGVGSRSVVSLQWAVETTHWPPSLLGHPAGMAPLIQAVALRSHELAEAANNTLQSGRGALNELAAEVEDLRADRDRLAVELSGANSALVEYRENASVLKGRLAQLESLLVRAERARMAMLSSGHRFHSSLSRAIESYRGQRAWKVMLWIRKAYTLAGKGAFTKLARFVASTPFGPELCDADLHFPSLPAYMPHQLDDTFLPPAGSGAGMELAAPAPLFPTLHEAHSYDVLVLSIIDFDFRFQRPQQIAADMAGRGHRVFWISPARFLPPDSPVAFELSEIRDNIWEVRLRAPAPDIYLGSLDPGHRDKMLDSLEQAIRDCGISTACVYVQIPFWRQLAMGLRARHPFRVLYDCMDDWETFHNIGAFNKSEERHFIRECDVLLVTAERLKQKCLAQNTSPILVRNAADFVFFHEEKEVSKHLDGVDGPIIGYFGAIADWMDLDLVYDVARARPQYSFVLAGGVFDRDISRLKALPNTRFLGQLDYREMPKLLRGFDVSIIPFVVNQVTNATDPVKLYEYFSQGKPVVTTDMSELAMCGDLIYTARNSDEFARQLDAALSEADGDLPKRRIEFASENTWPHRVSVVDRAIRQKFPLVSILLVSHNSANYLGPCLDSILENTDWPSVEVVLVDNASKDASVEIAKAYAARDPRLKTSFLDYNAGFAAGNNRAARMAAGDYLVLLNVDTIVSRGWIGSLYRHLARDTSIGLIAPVTNFAGNELKIPVDYADEAGMHAFADRLHIEQYGRTFDIDVAPLFCGMLRHDVWKKIGGLDELYEVGMFEDDDFSITIRDAGYRVVGAGDTFIHHFGQGSFAQLPSEQYQRIFEANRSRFEKKWKRSWTPHVPGNGVTAAHDDIRFDPVDFCAARAVRKNTGRPD